MSSGSTLTEETLSLFFLIQSGDFAPDDLSERVRSFLPKLYEDLQNLSQQEFETIRRSVLQQFGASDEIDEATGRLFQILFEEDGDFDFKSDKLRSLASLEHQDFLQRGRQMLEPTQQRQLVLQMDGAGMSSLLPEGVVRNASDMAERLPCPGSADQIEIVFMIRNTFSQVYRLASIPLVLLCVSCVSSSKTFLPDGSEGYVVTCSGSMLSWGDCEASWQPLRGWWV